MHPRMNWFIRFWLVFLSFLLIAAATLLLMQNSWFSSLWLWPSAPWLSDVFMASIFFSTAAAYLVAAVHGRLRPLRTISMSSLIGFGGCSLYLLLEATRATQDTKTLLHWGEIGLLYTIVNFLFLAAAYNSKIVSKRRLPVSLIWILGVVVIANLWVSLRLIFGIDAFAWKLTEPMAIIYGWTLLGAGIFAWYMLIEPYWENIWPLLGAFIAYGLTLTGPIIYLLINPTIVPVIYSRVVAYLLLVLFTFLSALIYAVRGLYKQS
ncbi:hypothetical protein [Legionella spiritensis]|uniref:Uncharacterized protein n=2 Tax=Legionella spiritensis TaxID=452 RepID=A0A0W0Z9B2_LEGSP|nr:hypothetical protein [Legionella spiritensis]KTD65712.1 hypothetical protein Lspi_0424 [Legionella spiritensis]SNV43339.1 Uncharacterised protein [Legionella spiritensis]